jgi:hypothetical protein
MGFLDILSRMQSDPRRQRDPNSGGGLSNHHGDPGAAGPVQPDA